MPGPAVQGVCWAGLPHTRAALAACWRSCALRLSDGRRRRAADAASALGGHLHGRRHMASSGARRRGARCPGLPLCTWLRCPLNQHGIVLARRPVGLSARGCSRARLRLRPSAQPRVSHSLRSLRVLAQTQDQCCTPARQIMRLSAPWRDALSPAVTGQTCGSIMPCGLCPCRQPYSMHRRARRSCQDPWRVRSAAARHTGALLAAGCTRAR